VAQRTTVMLVDDLDGSDADESLMFGLDGVSYEIDLTAVHAASLRDALAPYIAHARRTGRGRGPAAPARRRAVPAPTSSSTGAGGREQNQAIRDWASRHDTRSRLAVASRPQSAMRFTAATPLLSPPPAPQAARPTRPSNPRPRARSRRRLPQRPPTTRQPRVSARTGSPSRNANTSGHGPARKASRSKPEAGSAKT